MPFTYSVETVGGGGVSARGQHITHITHSVHNPHYPDYTWQKRYVFFALFFKDDYMYVMLIIILVVNFI